MKISKHGSVGVYRLAHRLQASVSEHKAFTVYDFGHLTKVASARHIGLTDKQKSFH
jgi:hypothetical protein